MFEFASVLIIVFVFVIVVSRISSANDGSSRRITPSHNGRRRGYKNNLN